MITVTKKDLIALGYGTSFSADIIDKLSAMLSCGHATARKIGEQAGAKIVIGRRVLYSVEKVKNYLSYLEE